MQTRKPTRSDDSKDSDPRSVNDLLKNQGLQFIVNKAKHLQNLTGILQNVLPEHFARHCVVLNIQGSRLSIGLKEPSFLTELRFLTPSLLPKLKTIKGFQFIHSIQVKICKP